MTQAVTSMIDRYAADFRAFQDMGEGPEWLREVRESAFARFLDMGFPTARRANEPWKYTNVGPIAETEFVYPMTDGGENFELPAVIPLDEDWPTVIVANGGSSVHHGEASIDRLSLGAAWHRGDEALKSHLGQYAAAEDDAFIALNTAFIGDGAFVHVPSGESSTHPLHIVHVWDPTDGATVAYPRTLIVAEPLSRLTVIETYAGKPGARYFTNAVTEIVLKEGAQVEHYRLLLESADAYHIGNTRVYQERDSRFSSMSFAAGAAIGRNDFRVRLDAPGAECSLNGLYVTTGTQHIDNNMNIDHAKPHTRSRLYYKGILDGKSKAVFGGLVLVRPGADKTDAYQQDKNLVLSDEAEVDSKPSLEIYADDVKCGHGATAGAVAEDAIFYLRSRGLNEETANNLLIKGFASEILDTVPIDSLRGHLENLTMAALSRDGGGRAGLKPAPTERLS
jgi:Fe-S cluster assembly protein SufD